MTLRKYYTQKLILLVINSYLILEFWPLTKQVIDGRTSGRVADSLAESIVMFICTAILGLTMLTMKRKRNPNSFMIISISTVLYLLMAFPSNRIKLPIVTALATLGIIAIVFQSIKEK